MALSILLQYVLLLEGLLGDVNDLAKKDKKFDATLKDFENQKVALFYQDVEAGCGGGMGTF